MKQRLTKEFCESLLRLQSNPDWQKFLSVLGDEGESIVESMITGSHDDTTLRELKGRAAAYTSILRAISETRATLEKFEVADGENKQN